MVVTASLANLWPLYFAGHSDVSLRHDLTPVTLYPLKRGAGREMAFYKDPLSFLQDRILELTGDRNAPGQCRKQSDVHLEKKRHGNTVASWWKNSWAEGTCPWEYMDWAASPVRDGEIRILQTVCSVSFSWTVPQHASLPSDSEREEQELQTGTKMPCWVVISAERWG